MAFVNLFESDFRVRSKVCIVAPGPNGREYTVESRRTFRIVVVSKAVLVPELQRADVWVMTHSDQDWFDDANRRFGGIRVFSREAAERARARVHEPRTLLLVRARGAGSVCGAASSCRADDSIRSDGDRVCIAAHLRLWRRRSPALRRGYVGGRVLRWPVESAAVSRRHVAGRGPVRAIGPSARGREAVQGLDTQSYQAGSAPVLAGVSTTPGAYGWSSR